MLQLINAMLDILKSDTFWSAVNALATLAGVAAIIFAAKRLRFDAWLKAQEIWVSPEFTEARGKVFARLDDLTRSWTPEEKVIALNVCQRVDEFVRLAPYLGQRRIVSGWGDPLAKAWLILEPLVREERDRTGWSTKWDAFEKIGATALATRPDLQTKRKQITNPSNNRMDQSGG